MSQAGLLLKGAALTVGLSLGAMAIALVLGTVMGVLQSRRLRRPAVSRLLGAYGFVMQGVPFYVQLLIFYFVFPEIIGVNFSPAVAGFLALGLCSSAYVAQIVRGAMNALPDGQWDAAQVLGLSRLSALRIVILPQAFTNALPALSNELVNVIKSTAMISAIGALELTKVGMNIVSRNMDPVPTYAMLAALYLVIVAGVMGLMRTLEHRWRPVARRPRNLVEQQSAGEFT
jgi:polar amino acid transport system permease protein